MPQPVPAFSTPDHIDLLFNGPVFCDLVFADVELPRPGEEVYSRAFAFTPGGYANGAVAGARLGATTAILAEIGDDPLGVCIQAMLAKEAGLHLNWLTQRSGFQSPVTVSLTGSGERCFVSYQVPQLELEWPADGPSLGAILVGAARRQPTWVSRQRDLGARIYGYVSWEGAGAWSREILDGLGDLDVLVLNEKEAAAYTPTGSVEEAARFLGDFVDVTVVTRGSKGSISYDRTTEQLLVTEAEDVTAVDPTGAGDVFLATLMAADAWGWPLADRLRLAGLTASLSVRSLGGAAGAPRRSDIDDYLRQVAPLDDWARIRAWAGGQAH